ncbi:MAG: hypothetical protein AMJ78_05430 [Omnitrophica WOR_2 bacterium SM23_29]|nr:MAG: hypothetical protein AMJ78_05430 [Omnitrophica WOR_2 bacterium SM23_29]
MNVSYKYGLLVFVPLFITLTLGCSKTPTYSRTEFVMGTSVVISVFDSDKSKQTIKAAVDAAFEEIKRVDTLMSNYKDNSEVSEINRLKGGERIKVSDETMEVLRRSREISALTKGAFDITVLPLLELWGFYGDSNTDRRPADKEIRAVLKSVGYKKLKLGGGNSVIKSKDGVKIILGGIAKGYAVDRAVRILKSRGIKSVLVEAGGDLICAGVKPDKNLWKIAIRHPRVKHKPIAILETEGCAIATSGDYENYHIVEGKRCSHIIDPRRGYPRGDLPASVTVIAKDVATADGLATAVFVLGPVEGMKFVENTPDIEAIIISDEAGEIKTVVSSGLKERIIFPRN